MCDVYRLFSKDWEGVLDYSDDSMMELFISESYGGPVSNSNGFYVGKQYLNVTVSMWKEDMDRGILFLCELYDDPVIPDWWLDKVFKGKKS